MLQAEGRAGPRLRPEASPFPVVECVTREEAMHDQQQRRSRSRSVRSTDTGLSGERHGRLQKSNQRRRWASGSEEELSSLPGKFPTQPWQIHRRRQKQSERRETESLEPNLEGEGSGQHRLLVAGEGRGGEDPKEILFQGSPSGEGPISWADTEDETPEMFTEMFRVGAFIPLGSSSSDVLMEESQAWGGPKQNEGGDGGAEDELNPPCVRPTTGRESVAYASFILQVCGPLKLGGCTLQEEVGRLGGRA